jgi:hypothetical protein
MESSLMPDRAPWIDTAFGEPPQVAQVTALPNPNEEPYFVPPHQDTLDIRNELLPATGYTPQVLPDEQVGATTDPFHASKEAAYAQTYNPAPVMAPPAIAALVDQPYGNPFIVGRAAPDYGEDQWNPAPKLPQPDIAAEIIPAFGYSSQVMPDEMPGAWQPYTYAATPAPEHVFNPYPVQPELSITDIVRDKLA